MSCPAFEQLAAAATGADDAVLVHASTCAACLAAIEDQRALRALAQRAPAVVLTRERREAMAAELMARADQLPAVSAPRDPMQSTAPSASHDVDGVRVLTQERRDAMAAELMAQADEADASVVAIRRAARRRTAALVVAGLAAAAALVLVVATRGAGPDRSGGRDLAAGGSAAASGAADPRATGSNAAGSNATNTNPTATDPLAADGLATDGIPADSRTTDGRTTDGRTAAARTSAKLAGSGDYERDARVARSTRDVVRLRGGELTVDSTGSRPVEIVSGGTAIAVTKARVKVVSTRGVVSSVAVFAGSAEVTVDGHRVIVEAGTVWERDGARDEALAAFRTGWTALRSGDHAAAITAFDRATDPIVAEDATYWSAIASERSGDTAGAVRRYRELLTKFPQTTRATEARSAIARLEP